MPRTLYLSTPNSETDLLYADVYQRSGDPEIPDTVTGNFPLDQDLNVEITLQDDEYILVNIHPSV